MTIFFIFLDFELYFNSFRWDLFSVYSLVFELNSLKWDYFSVYLLVFELISFKWDFFSLLTSIEIFACTLMTWDLYSSSVMRFLTILWNKTRLCVLQILFHFYFSFKRSGLIWSDFTKTKHSRLFFVSL